MVTSAKVEVRRHVVDNSESMLSCRCIKPRQRRGRRRAWRTTGWGGSQGAHDHHNFVLTTDVLTLNTRLYFWVARLGTQASTILNIQRKRVDCVSDKERVIYIDGVKKGIWLFSEGANCKNDILYHTRKICKEPWISAIVHEIIDTRGAVSKIKCVQKYVVHTL